MDNKELLIAESSNFVRDLNTTFLSIWNKSPFFILESKGDDQVVRSKKLLLTKRAGSRNLSGDFGYCLSLDRESKYLSVQESYFKFYIDDDSEPLFRYDFVKSNSPTVPRAHIQFHLDRNHPDRAKLADLITRKSQELSSVHFPLGGEFLRPCLEDVLLTCHYDLGIGLNDSDTSLLLKRVRAFRKTQAKAIYREYLASEFGPLRLKDTP